MRNSAPVFTFLLLVPLCCLCGLLAPLWAEEIPAFVDAYGHPAMHAGEWGRPPAFASDASKLYLGTRQIDLYDRATGDWLQFLPFSSPAHGVGAPWPPGHVEDPGPYNHSEVSGLAIGSGGDLFVLDRRHAAVHRYDHNGVYLLGWGGRGEAPELCPEGHYFTSICTTPDGSVYVLDTLGEAWDAPEPGRVRRFDENGALLASWATHTGTGDEQWSPWEIATVPSGGVWLLDWKWRKSDYWHPEEAWLFRYSPDGTETTSVLLPPDLLPYAWNDPRLASDPEGNAWVVLRGDDSRWLYCYGPDGGLLSEQAFGRSYPFPSDLAIAPDGHLLLLFSQNLVPESLSTSVPGYRVETWDQEGAPIASVGEPGELLLRGALAEPTRMAGTPTGEVFAKNGVGIPDEGSGTKWVVSRYDAEGALAGVAFVDQPEMPRYNPVTGMVEMVDPAVEPAIPGPDGNSYSVEFTPGWPESQCTVTKTSPDGQTILANQFTVPQAYGDPYTHESAILTSFGPDGSIWIAQSAMEHFDTGWGCRVWVGQVSPSIELLRSWQTDLPSMRLVEAFGVDHGSGVYLGGAGGLWKYRPDGMPVGRVGGWGGTGDQRDAPESLILRTSGVVIDAAGSVRVLDKEAGRVLQFSYTPAPFSDVPYWHWAKDEVAAAVGAGIVAGYEDGLYHPELAVTRDQMAVYIARALEAPSGEAVLADWVPADPQDFPDVPSDHWAYTHIEYCVENGVVTGYEDGTYHPEYEVTRDQMAVYVARSLVAPSGEAGLADYVPADPRNFLDVPEDFWAYTHIEYCVENGVVQGYEDGHYHPQIVVTRDQMAVYVARASGLGG
jgi:hypothetical protein